MGARAVKVAAAAPSRPLPALPKAARDQVTVELFEADLVTAARVYHPTVSWWHGYRRAEERFGSYCYLCEAFTVTWSGNGGPPKAAVTAIDAHKRDHAPGTVPGATSPDRKRK